MLWTTEDVAHAIAGAVHGQPQEISGVAIDSRTIAPGQLFVPVVAERNGHEFIQRAVDAGAVAYLTSEQVEQQAAAAIVVADTNRALLALGGAARTRLGGQVVGVTGSVGKTSTKDMIVSALSSRNVWANERSFNNELGVPLTLVNAPEDADVVVTEMGARGPGHIRLLCEIARPTVGVVTAVAAAHTETFGSIEGVAQAKGELVEALPSSGFAVLNGDDDRVIAMANRTSARVVAYSAAGGVQANLTAEDVVFDEQVRARFRLRSEWGIETVSLNVSGRHQVSNALAAAAVGLSCGSTIAEVSEGLSKAKLSPWRMEVGHTSSGAVVINDAYNANPTSVASALRTLAAMPAARRVAVLGRMAELGPDEVAAHQSIFQLAQELEIEVLAVGTDMYGARMVESTGDVLPALGQLGAGDAVLLKGSRVAGLETVAVALGV